MMKSYRISLVCSCLSQEHWDVVQPWETNIFNTGGCQGHCLDEHLTRSPKIWVLGNSYEVLSDSIKRRVFGSSAERLNTDSLDRLAGGHYKALSVGKDQHTRALHIPVWKQLESASLFLPPSKLLYAVCQKGNGALCIFRVRVSQED